MKPRAPLLLAAPWLLTACLLAPPEPTPAPALIMAAPPACSVAAAAKLQLPPTQPPLHGADQSDAAQLAQVHTINRPLPEVAVWQGFENGWSRLSLQLGSAYAHSIAVRLRDISLPPQGAIWLCSAGGNLRQGPLQPDAQAELWSAAMPGEQVRLEIWVPSLAREQVRAQLSELYAGYR